MSPLQFGEKRKGGVMQRVLLLSGLVGLATCSRSVVQPPVVAVAPGDASSAVVEFYEEGNYGLRSDGFLIRIFAFDRAEERDRRIRFLGDLARGRHTLALATPPGEREYIVIVEPARSEAAPAETRSLARLEPNVRLQAIPGHVTRVRVGLVAALAVHGIDRRSDFGTSETQRTPPRRGTPSFESDDSSVSLPGASQFSTDIEVEEPLPLGEK
jgi:hypothetical protein